MRRRWSPAAALRAVTAEAAPRLRSIGRSPTEAQRFRRAEDRADLPVFPLKSDCPGCVASRAADAENRWPVGDCSRDCLRRAARRAS